MTASKCIEGMAVIKTRLCSMVALSLIVLQAIIALACAEEVLLATKQPLTFESGTTLVVEDVDQKQGKIWLAIHEMNRTPESAVLAMGENLSGRGVNLTVNGIYVGGDVDLVALDLKANGSVEDMRSPLAAELGQENSSPTGSGLNRSPGFPGALALFVLAGYLLVRPR